MIRVGPVTIDPPVALAPMEGVTDRAFRAAIRELGGCGLTVTEFVSSEGMTREVEDAWRMAELDPDEHPVSIQIYGRDPARMAAAARACQQLGADIIDINFGCPSKRVTGGCSGSALMREPDTARRILDAVYAAIDVPMTVKMRLGWDLDSINAPEIAASAEAAGAAMITVHGRTRACGYSGHARWDEVAAVKRAVSVPVLVNGDIVDPASARAALAASGADGVMVGRAVMTDPWAIARIAADLTGAAQPQRPSPAARRHVVDRYLDRVAAEGRDDRRAMAKVRRVVGYLAKGTPQAARLRQQLNTAPDIDSARRIVDELIAPS